MKYNCLVIDDNEIERDAIEMHLKKIPDLHIIATCASGIEAAAVLARTEIDIVFSDIDMPELSGTALLKSLKKHPVFIFITSYSEYAAESYDLDALDFIVKPATFERILKASNKAIEYLDLKKSAQKEIVTPGPAVKLYDQNDDVFFVKETKGISRLKYSDVLYIESMGDFSKIYTINNKYTVLVGLKQLEHQFPLSSFRRVHKQYIININQILTITNHEVHLNFNHVVPITAVNRQELLDNLIDQKTLSRFKNKN